MKIALALGGGGSKGIAHMGVLRCLEREGIQTAAVAGTSAGGIVAALYAAGYSPDEILQRFKQLDFSQMYGHDPGERPSLFGAAGVRKVVTDMLADRTFTDLNIPAVLISVDLRSGKEILLRAGSVAEAVMATIALPGLLPPVELDDLFLVDGGVLDPVPVAPARSLAPQLPVVAVVLSSLASGPREVFSPPRIIQSIPLVSRFSRLRLAQAFNIFMHSIEVAGSYTTELRLQIDQPDVVVRPELSDIGLFDRVDVERVALLGDQAMAGALTAIRQAHRWDRRVKRYFFRHANRPGAGGQAAM